MQFGFLTLKLAYEESLLFICVARVMRANQIEGIYLSLLNVEDAWFLIKYYKRCTRAPPWTHPPD